MQNVRSDSNVNVTPRQRRATLALQHDAKVGRRKKQEEIMEVIGEDYREDMRVL